MGSVVEFVEDRESFVIGREANTGELNVPAEGYDSDLFAAGRFDQLYFAVAGAFRLSVAEHFAIGADSKAFKPTNARGRRLGKNVVRRELSAGGHIPGLHGIPLRCQQMLSVGSILQSYNIRGYAMKNGDFLACQIDERRRT